MMCRSARPQRKRCWLTGLPEGLGTDLRTPLILLAIVRAQLTHVQNHHTLNISLININIQDHFTSGLVQAGIIIANYIPRHRHRRAHPRPQYAALTGDDGGLLDN